MGAVQGPLYFRLDPRTGIAPYRQLVDQVVHAIGTGVLRPGERLPSVREVVTQIPINPNTVHRAYRELENLGLVAGRPGLGTFVSESARPQTTPKRQAALQEEIGRWVRRARSAGLDHQGILGLVTEALDQTEAETGGRR